MAERFKIVKKGYDPATVDEYIGGLEIAIKGYNEKDAAIKNAIISAQYAADEIIRKAKIAEDDIIRNARNQSVEIIAKTTSHVQSILALIKTQKEVYDNFTTEYNEVVSKYLHQANEKDFAAVNEKFNALERYLLSFVTNPETEDDK